MKSAFRAVASFDWDATKDTSIGRCARPSELGVQMPVEELLQALLHQPASVA